MEYFSGFFKAKTDPVEAQSSRPQPPPIKASTLAGLADDVYGRDPARSEPIDGFRPLGEDQLKAKGIDPAMLHPASGSHAQVYADDHGRAVLAFRGTVNPKAEIVEREYDGPSGLDVESDMLGFMRGKEYGLRISDVEQSARDWTTNLRQGLGLETAQHNDTVALAKQVNEAFGADRVVMTGHSKGGGQAALAASLFGNEAVTFNPAAPHDDTLRRYGADPERVRSDAPKHITSIVTHGEILDRVQGREVSFAPLIRGSIQASRLDEHGDSSDLFADIDPEKAKVKIPVALGRRVDVEPDAALDPVACHSMGRGILPYASQFDAVEVMRAKPVESAEALPTPSFARTSFGLFDPMTAHLLHGRFHPMWPQPQPQILLSDARHPANGLYEQALERVGALGVEGRDAERLSGALVVAAQRNGLSAIDDVVFNQDRTRAFAVQGEADSPEARRADVGYAAAIATDLAVSSRASALLPVPEPPVREEQSLCRIM